MVDSAARLRPLFWLATLALAASLWLSPRLPMADLPQHAGQIALWRDLLRGASPFADEVRINLFTPYLIGYGLALPLAFVVSATEAVRLVLAAAFVAFVAAGRGLRRDVGGDERLDWLLLFGFFGFAFAFGFYTFLVAAPAAMLTLRLAVRHDAEPSFGRGAALVGAGALLLLCHGLQFIFVDLACAAIVLERALRALRANGLRATLIDATRRAIPGATLALIFVAFLLARRLAVGADPAGFLHFGLSVAERPLAALIFVWGLEAQPVLLALTLCAALAPLFAGWRIAPGPGRALLALVVVVLLFGFEVALDTGFLYQRFALYLLPFWVLALRPAAAPRRFALGQAAVALLAVTVGALHVGKLIAFAREDGSFATILAAARPGERVLNMAFEDDSTAIDQPHAYLHWGAWLQAERGAFVDFNFAYFAPQVVRFRPGKTPPVLQEQSARPDGFDWARWEAARYDAFLLRADAGRQASFVAKAKAQSGCDLAAAASAGLWTLYRKAASCGR